MRNRGFNGLKLLVVAFLCVSVIFPLITLILNIKGSDIQTILSSPQFLPMITNSLITTTIAML
ncbi:MAG: phosphonate ABC transporter permease, partial [Longicatena sp.]